MRKIWLLTFLLTLVLAGCSTDDAAPGGDQQPSLVEEGSEAESEAAGAGSGGGSEAATIETVTEGVLTVGTELPAPPFWIGEDYSSIEGGYEVDLAREIADRLGLDGVEFVEMPFAGLVAGQECPCDLALAQVTITEERAQVVDFTAPYFDANQGILVAEGTQVASTEDARALQWGVQVNTTAVSYLADTLRPEREPQVYNTVVDAFTALRAGQVDAVMLDTPIVLGEAGRPDSGLEVVGQFETGEQYGGVLPKDSPSTEVLSGIIEDLREDGFLEELGAEYFNDPASVPVLEAP